MDGFVQAENERIQSNLIRLGTVVELDEKNARIRVESAGQETGWVPWATGRAGATSHWSAPRKGEQVMLLSPYGDMAQGVAMLGVYSDAHPAPADSQDVERTTYPDGTTVTYDSAAHELRIEAGSAKIFITCTDATVTASGKVELDTPEVHVTGDVKVDGDVVAGSVSLRQHIHTGVQSGPSLTGPPEGG